MNVKQISYGILGGLMLAGVCTSCVDETMRDKAKAKAVKYLDGNQLLRAERGTLSQHADDRISGEEVAYWDSLLIEAKAKEAYVKGQQMVRDSAEGKFFRKAKYQAKLDTIIPSGLIDNIKKEYSNYTNAEDFIKMRENAPSEKHGMDNELPYQIHYWDLITMAGKQREAYEKGAADERAKINQPKETESENDAVTKAAIEACNAAITKDVIEKNAVMDAVKEVNK